MFLLCRALRESVAVYQKNVFLNYVIKKGFMLSVFIWSYGREREDWRAQVARGDLSNKPMFYLNICCFLCRWHEVLPGIQKKVTMTTFASGVIRGKSILMNPSANSLGHRWKSICETAPEPLFWDLNCVPGWIWVRAMIGLLKNALSICQSTWREIRNAFPVISLGTRTRISAQLPRLC